MGRLDHYDETDRRRIKALARKLIEGQIESGALECSDDAIRAAMPKAVEDARQMVMAVNEYLCG